MIVLLGGFIGVRPAPNPLGYELFAPFLVIIGSWGLHGTALKARGVRIVDRSQHMDSALLVASSGSAALRAGVTLAVVVSLEGLPTLFLQRADCLACQLCPRSRDRVAVCTSAPGPTIAPPLV